MVVATVTVWLLTGNDQRTRFRQASTRQQHQINQLARFPNFRNLINVKGVGFIDTILGRFSLGGQIDFAFDLINRNNLPVLAPLLIKTKIILQGKGMIMFHMILFHVWNCGNSFFLSLWWQ